MRIQHRNGNGVYCCNAERKSCLERMNEKLMHFTLKTRCITHYSQHREDIKCDDKYIIDDVFIRDIRL
jgi:hypothetical protein